MASNFLTPATDKKKTFRLAAPFGSVRPWSGAAPLVLAPLCWFLDTPLLTYLSSCALVDLTRILVACSPRLSAEGTKS